MADGDRGKVTVLEPAVGLKTLDDLRKLSPDEINERWPEVSAILSTGKPPKEKIEPETLEDLKGISVDDAIAFWPRIVKILEGQARAERAAKLKRAEEDRIKAATR